MSLQVFRDPLKILTDFVVQAPSYIIFKDSSGRIYAKNGDTGQIEFVDTDISNLLQNVINTLYSKYSGGRVFIKRGVYFPTKTINIPDGINLIIEGEGNNTVFKYTSQFILFLHRNEASPTWTSTIIFKNFKIDRSGSGSNNTDIISITYARFVKFENIEIVDDYREVDGDAGIAGYNNIVAVAENCRVYNKSYGIWLFGLLSILKGNYVENTAKVGIGGAGLLPQNFQLPPGYSAGGITIIEDNVCIDCGRVDEAISVDYGASSPSNYGVGIIRNNLVATRNYSTKHFITAIRVAKVVIENNVVEGSATDAAVLVSTSGTGAYCAMRNNVINVTMNGVTPSPIVIYRDVVILENNRVNAVYQNISSNPGQVVYTDSVKMIARGNVFITSIPSGYRVDSIIHSELRGDDTNPSLAEVESNEFYVNGNVYYIVFVAENNSYSSAKPFVKVVKNLMNVVNGSANVLFNIVMRGNVEYAVVRDNMTNANVASKVGGWASVSGATLYIDSDIPVSVSMSYYYTKVNKGVATFSGDGSTTQFKIPHKLATTPSKVLVMPGSKDASGSFYVTADSQYIYVNYSTAPPSGTNNVVLYWYAEV